MTLIDALEQVHFGRAPLRVLVDCCHCHQKYLIYEGGHWGHPGCPGPGVAMARELPFRRGAAWCVFDQGSYAPR